MLALFGLFTLSCEGKKLSNYQLLGLLTFQIRADQIMIRIYACVCVGGGGDYDFFPKEVYISGKSLIPGPAVNNQSYHLVHPQ